MKWIILFIFLVLSFASKPRLIAFSDEHVEWMTAEQVEKLETLSDNFMDITDFQVPIIPNIAIDPVPTKLTQQAIVKQLLPSVDVDVVKSIITKLSSYFNRYYQTKTGVEASHWIYNQLVSWSADREDITVEFFNNTFLVPSVIARIQGYQGDEGATRVIIGAHQDSTAGGPSQKSPGADDDASGTSSVLEAFRVIAQSGFKPARTIEFHLYSGEEAGLLGSQAIASLYATLDIDVEAMLNLDMTGYGKDDQPIAIISDNTNIPLNKFIKLLVKNYTILSFVDDECGYGCSDHSSWTKYGYRASFPFEAKFAEVDPFIHTAKDTIDKLNLKRSAEFVKLAIGFIVEMGRGSF